MLFWDDAALNMHIHPMIYFHRHFAREQCSWWLLWNIDDKCPLISKCLPDQHRRNGTSRWEWFITFSLWPKMSFFHKRPFFIARITRPLYWKATRGWFTVTVFISSCVTFWWCQQLTMQYDFILHKKIKISSYVHFILIIFLLTLTATKILYLIDFMHTVVHGGGSSVHHHTFFSFKKKTD